MKIKVLLAIVLIFMISKTSNAQLKINEYGRIGIGTEPNPLLKVQIKSSLVLTSYPEILSPYSTYNELRFVVDGYPIIGTPLGEIVFCSTEWGPNYLLAFSYNTFSDTSLKTDIQPVQDGLSKILQINSYSYKRKHDTIVESKRTYGFLAQEIQSLLPDVTDTAMRLMSIDYQQITPLLVEAVKEQQVLIDSLFGLINQEQLRSLRKTKTEEKTKIDSLRQELIELRKQIKFCCNQSVMQLTMTPAQKGNSSSSRLFQNKPNPFSENTTIEFEIFECFTQAFIMIFDMQGSLKKSIPISQNGKGQIVINGRELTAGMYLYSLIVEGKEIDTKRMILVNQ
jgi:hypothetical protein